ncbi:hypothetical protein PE067_18275 [Paracoccus sp. DMF-8]|uniref:hypothetical protein n=1 Tax=Paracoccus sp. DMF-8 TaxID=3019445 RepID=UPI0023E3A0B6|nr:hypothetical protein [Paracoccus sp. DMF-8]MDF3607913.1 hypothetical protein [Paracoccus sp. DMF-8]
MHTASPTNPLRRYNAAFGHPEVYMLAERLRRLYDDASLKPNEMNRACWSIASLQTLSGAYWHDLHALVGKPLPDPGCRPMLDAMHPYADGKKPDFQRMLGYYHRIREFAERAERRYFGDRHDD